MYHHNLTHCLTQNLGTYLGTQGESMAIRDDLKPTYDDDGHSKRPGVFYKEHPTRRHGVAKDKQFIIRYTIAGITRTEAYGWLSDGFTAQGAQDKIKAFKANHKAGKKPVCLADENVVLNAERAETSRKETTFGQFFEDVYFKQCEIDKAPRTAQRERLLFDSWINPVVGKLRFDQISIDHMEKIKGNMLTGKRAKAKPNPRDKSKAAKGAQQRRTPARPLAPRTVNYALAVVRQVWNRACASNPPLASGDWPGANKSFKKPKVDNRRNRFLTKNEAALLLAALRDGKSKDMHDMALLSLHCGLRAGEIFALTWDKVRLSKGELLLVDTKNGESRICYLTDQTLDMLRQRSTNCKHKRFVFIDAKEKPYEQVPVTYSRTVKKLGLNEGITDPRDKIVFHSLRHTYASWLVDNGASLPIVRDLLGHKSLVMTDRYTHVSAEAQKNAVEALNKSMKPAGENIVVLDEKRNSETGTN